MSKPLLAKRMQHIAPFRVMEILARAQAMQRQGVDLVHMEVGEPDFVAPAEVVAAAAAALNAGHTRYTPAAGLPALREALSGYYAGRFGVDVDPARILITPGASGALQLALAVLADTGDRVLLQDPGYPCNRHMLSLFGAVPEVLSGEAFDAQAAVAALNGARGIMLATPANPTGEVIGLDDLRQVYRAIDPQRQFLLVDEIYQGLQYDTPVRTALELGEPGLLVINSFSKYFGMTGFRLGWMVVPGDLAEPMERLAQNLFLAPSTPAQHAALSVFDDAVMAELERRREIFQARRDLLYRGLAGEGFALPSHAPGGAFYLYAGVAGLAESGERLAADLLQHVAVAITPGTDFGTRGTVDHVRFAYTTDEARLAEGLQRIHRCLRAGAD